MKTPREVAHLSLGQFCVGTVHPTGEPYHTPACNRVTAAIEAMDAEHAAEVARWLDTFHSVPGRVLAVHLRDGTWRADLARFDAATPAVVPAETPPLVPSYAIDYGAPGSERVSLTIVGRNEADLLAGARQFINNAPAPAVTPVPEGVHDETPVAQASQETIAAVLAMTTKWPYTPPTTSAPPAPREDWPPMAVKLDAGEPYPSPEVRLIRATPVVVPSAPSAPTPCGATGPHCVNGRCPNPQCNDDVYGEWMEGSEFQCQSCDTWIVAYPVGDGSWLFERAFEEDEKDDEAEPPGAPPREGMGPTASIRCGSACGAWDCIRRCAGVDGHDRIICRCENHGGGSPPRASK